MNAAAGVGTSSSLRVCAAAFRAAADPVLADLVGRHRAEMVGPFWMRRSAPLLLAATGMPGWMGKQFAAPSSADARELVGHNLVDDRSAIVLTYAPDAPFPWRNVVDEVRPVGDGRLLGLSYNIVPGVPVGAPFLLHRG